MRPSTATKLAERLGQSSGATSYHLRQLAEHGFVEEDTERKGPGRERWWKSAHSMTALPRGESRKDLGAEGFLRAVAVACYEEMDRFLAELATLPPRWDDGWTMSDRIMRLTPAEAKELRLELMEVVERYRFDEHGGPADAPKGAERVIVQVQVLPRLQDS